MASHGGCVYDQLDWHWWGQFHFKSSKKEDIVFDAAAERAVKLLWGDLEGNLQGHLRVNFSVREFQGFNLSVGEFPEGSSMVTSGMLQLTKKHASLGICFIVIFTGLSIRQADRDPYIEIYSLFILPKTNRRKNITTPYMIWGAGSTPRHLKNTFRIFLKQLKRNTSHSKAHSMFTNIQLFCHVNTRHPGPMAIPISFLPKHPTTRIRPKCPDTFFLGPFPSGFSMLYCRKFLHQPVLCWGQQSRHLFVASRVKNKIKIESTTSVRRAVLPKSLSLNCHVRFPFRR